MGCGMWDGEVVVVVSPDFIRGYACLTAARSFLVFCLDIAFDCFTFVRDFFTLKCALCMKTYTQILYQIVFSTKYRERTLDKSDRQALFQFIWGVLKNKRCHLYRINGVEDHLHIVTHLHPSVSLANLVKDIKLASSAYIKETGLFPHFRGWQDGYGAFTYSIESKHNLIEYVKRQEEHHKKESPREELIRLLQEQQVDFKEQYLDDYPPTDRVAVEPE